MNAMLYRKGEDGETGMKQCPGSDFSWRMFVFIVGEDNNTEENRKEIADKLIIDFNLHATPVLFKYPKKAKFGDDITAAPMRTLDACLLDSDVIGMMLAAFPDTSLDKISEYGEIMSAFWMNKDHGEEVIEKHISEFGADANAQNGDEHNTNQDG